ncbi:WD domain-containing protein [Beauveria brongniartii RCEF 3172]|uniref:WD domain-containing protein n=1 Tax=Beauveria brongniartii RCEF 3172 TaxID=1081107 RepID=A0A167AAP8_9HYPO|nr:WD domain-containing protein [Beauveria brongniartii RCEF 3172]
MEKYRAMPISTEKNHVGSRSQTPILPSFENPVPRRELLSAVANLGLQQMKDKEIAIRLLGHELHPNNAIIDVISVIEAMQNIVQDAVRDLPYAAMAMAGVSLVLPLNDNLRGFDHVTSQMSYYIEMEIRAFRVTRFFKGSLLFDDWRGKLDEIQSFEKTVLQRLKSAVSGESMKHLNLLQEDAEIIRQGVDSIVSELHTASNVLQRLERLEVDKEDQKYLASLLATDPRLAKQALQSAKEQPLCDSYEWIFGHEQFKQWQTDNDKTQHWISGDQFYDAIV